MSRYDLYGPVHKGLRLAATELLLLVGRTDFETPAEAARVVAEVDSHLDLCASHIQHEEDHIHAALERRCPGVTQVLDSDHEHHRRTLADLRAKLDGVRAAPSRATGQALYLALARFTADDFAHMDREEGAVTDRLHAAFTDEELAAMEGAILASLSPELSMRFLLLILRAASRSDQKAQLEGVRASAPPPVFDAILAAVEPHLPGVVAELRQARAAA